MDTTRKRRVRTGCLTCRARKVKCDERPGRCTKCETVGAECRWAGTGSETSSPYSPVQAVRRPIACLTCRQARAKCSQNRPTCDRCYLYKLPCRYTAAGSSTSPAPQGVTQSPLANGMLSSTVIPTPALAPELAPPLASALTITPSPWGHAVGPGLASSGLALPPIGARVALCTAFFTHVHPYQYHAFLHRDATFLALAEDRMVPAVLLALCSVGARFTRPRTSQEDADRWAKEASTLVLDSNCASRDNVKAALLLAIHASYSGRFPSSHNWCAIANRQALSLGLHRESPITETRSWVDAEADRRLFFACYGLERNISDGSPETVYCNGDRVKLRLPCEGYNFCVGLPCETPDAQLDGEEPDFPPWMYSNVGAMGFYIRLVGARFYMKRYQFDLNNGIRKPGMEPWSPQSPFNTCLRKLDHINHSLPVRMRFDTYTKSHKDVLGPRIMFSVRWHSCHVELYRMAIAGYPESLSEHMLAEAPEDWLQHARDACLNHARAIRELLCLADNTLIVDHSLPRVVYTSVRIQLELLGSQATADMFDVMIGYVIRLSEYFRTAYIVLKEIRKLLAKHGLFDLGNESRAETPQHPWLIRQKAIDGSRQTEVSPSIADELLQSLLLGTLPEIAPIENPFPIDDDIAAWLAAASVPTGLEESVQRPAPNIQEPLLPTGTMGGWTVPALASFEQIVGAQS